MCLYHPEIFQEEMLPLRSGIQSLYSASAPLTAPCILLPPGSLSLLSVKSVLFVLTSSTYMDSPSLEEGVPEKSMYMVSFYRVLVSASVTCCG